ncbi:MAG: SUMF1/EgtB/PvdO family nonheme iron enzyme [Phocaeicola sp.]
MKFKLKSVAVLLTFLTLGQSSFANELDKLERLKWVKIEAMESAIADMSRQKGFNKAEANANLAYVKSNLPALLQSLEAGDKSDATMAKVDELLKRHRSILLSNPVLDMDKIFTSRFGLGAEARTGTLNKMCMPMANYVGVIDVPAAGYDAQIVELSDLRGEKAKERTIYKSQRGEGISDMQLHWDADRIIFSGGTPIVLDSFYGQSYPNWHIFEVNTNSGELKHITAPFKNLPDIEYGDPCYLPDGRIIFTNNIGYNGIPCEHGERIIMNLAIFDPKDNSMRKLTFDQDGNWSPTVLHNGRIMYTRYEYTDLTHYFTRIVMHSNPDGTDARALYGSGSYWPTSVFDMQQLPGTSSTFVGTVSGHHGIQRSGRLVIIDPNKGRKEISGVVQELPYKDRPVVAEMKDRLVDGVWPQFSKPFPLNDKYFVTTAKLHPGGLWGIYLVDVHDNLTLIAEEEGSGFLTPMPAIKRPTPPAIPDRVILGEKESTVFIQDIYEGEGLRGVPKGVVKKLRVFTYEYAYMKSPSDFDALGVQSGWDLKRELGTVDVEEDGSVIFKVPANSPISLQPLDEEGNAIQWMRSWFTAMPGEILSCIGCHEDQNKVPIPKKVIASSKKPSVIKAPEGGVRPFSYELEIQPILDRNCTSCHDGENGTMDLSRKHKTEYKRWGNYTTHRYAYNSYFNIHPYVHRQGPEAELYVLRPYEYHGSNSELIQMLEKGHHGVELSKEDLNKLYHWIDFNAPYFGDFEISGRYKATYDQYPRRMQLMQRFANVSNDWKAELANYAKYLDDKTTTEGDAVKAVKLQPAKSTKAAPSGLTNWGFSPTTAKEMQTKEKTEATKVIEVTPGVEMKLVWIPAGKFAVNEAGKAKNTTIKKGFWMGELEVTNQQYCALVPEHDSRFFDQQWKDHTTPGLPANKPEQPVIRISWGEAMAYCEELSKKTGMNVTLPTAEQWEWAARAGSTEDFWFGNVGTDYSEYDNMADFMMKDLAVWGLDPTFPIPDSDVSTRRFWDYALRDRESNDKNVVSVKGGQYKPNHWGLYDLHGNVAEWTASSTELGKFKGDKIVKGGSWKDRAKNSTASTEKYFKEWQAPFNVGFRVIIEE